MFSHYGGDIESWLLHIKISHGSRIFGKKPDNKRRLKLEDLELGMENFKIAKENKLLKEKEEFDKRMIQTMFL